MELNIEQQRQQAHWLLDGLPEDKLTVVRNLLEVLAEPHTDSVSQSLANAPWEDEELTPETIAALDRASASFDQGGGVSHEELRREFGL